uniref:NADH dehydrogenase subunit 6 n=1 Tax=Plectus sambesii TaxID=2011161 RepID=A0A914VGH3_9BILA
MIRSSTLVCIAFLVAVAASQTYAQDTTKYLPYYLIGVLISWILWIGLAVVGYVKGGWSVCACVLVVIFGIFGVCCALAMTKRSTEIQID